MYKIKIFTGTYQNMADNKFNEWIKDNSNIDIISFKYQQVRYGDHIICILYKEV